MTISFRDQKNFLLTIFVSSLVIRIAFFCFFTRYGTNAWIYVDSEQYHSIAQNLLTGNGFSLDQAIAQYYRLPGYPLFLALCYKIFSHSWRAALLIQIVFSSLIPIFMFYLSSVLVQNNLRLARSAAIISVIYPGFVLYAGMLATETLTVLFLLLFAIFFLPASGIWQLFVAGTFLGLVSLIRPIGHYVILLSFIILYFRNKRILAAIKQSFLLFLGWVVAVSPWLIRNFLLTGALFFHSLPGLHFLQYTAAYIVTQAQNINYPQARAQVLEQWNDLIDAQERAENRTLNDYDRSIIGERLARSYVFSYPWLVFKYSFGELAKTCFGLYSAIILLADGAAWPDYGASVTLIKKIKRFLLPSLYRPWLVVFIYLEIFMLFLILLGWVLFLITTFFDLQARALFYVITPYIILFIGLTLAYGGARLRMPADPFIILGALYGWCSSFKRARES